MADVDRHRSEAARRAARYPRILVASVLSFGLHGVFLVNAIEEASSLGWVLYAVAVVALVVAFVIEGRLERRRRALAVNDPPRVAR